MSIIKFMHLICVIQSMLQLVIVTLVFTSKLFFLSRLIQDVYSVLHEFQYGFIQCKLVKTFEMSAFVFVFQISRDLTVLF